jgi:hypothetical protein
LRLGLANFCPPGPSDLHHLWATMPSHK